MEIPCFLPLISQVRYYEHRQRIVDLPLFPSYVFIFSTREQVHAACSTRRIAHVLPVEDQRRLEHELLQLDLALAGQAVLDPYPYLAVGRRVEVVRGPFLGIQGLIDERRSPDRLVLNVSMLGRSMSLEIDASLLELID
jgi:transcription antitermination factor NusG